MSCFTLRTRSSYSISRELQVASEMVLEGSQVERNFSIPPQFGWIFLEGFDPRCCLDMDWDSSESEFSSFSEFFERSDGFS